MDEWMKGRMEREMFYTLSLLEQFWDYRKSTKYTEFACTVPPHQVQFGTFRLSNSQLLPISQRIKSK